MNTDEENEKLKNRINEIFKNNKFPGYYNIVGNNGIEKWPRDEQIRVREACKEKNDWRKLDAKFLDELPDGLASALNFFSPPAFRFYLPAYLIADIDNKLSYVDLIFHLCDYFTNSQKDEYIGEIYGETTWCDYGIYRFSTFTLEEVEVIIEYLQYKSKSPSLELSSNLNEEKISQALENYWLKRFEYLKNKKGNKK